METDITVVFLKYLIKYNKIDIDYLKDIDDSKFLRSNLHKIISSLCINYINIGCEILDKTLQTDIKMYRNSLIHCEGSVNVKSIKSGIIKILKDIERLTDVDEYDEYEYMIY